MGDKCRYYTVDKGLAGGATGRAGHLSSPCATSSAIRWRRFRPGFGPHAAEIMADIPKYTDLSPVIQISEVVVERS